MKVRLWKVDDELPSYEESEPFFSFLNKYATHIVGTRILGSWIKDNPGKNLLDKLTSYRIMSYAVLIYENAKEVWVENEDTKKMHATDDQRKNTNKLVVPKYHVKKGTKLPLYTDGWMDEGRLYFKTLNK